MLYKFKVNNEDMSQESFFFLDIIALDQGHIPTATLQPNAASTPFLVHCSNKRFQYKGIYLFVTVLRKEGNDKNFL